MKMRRDLEGEDTPLNPSFLIPEREFGGEEQERCSTYIIFKKLSNFAFMISIYTYFFKLNKRVV